MSPKRFFLIAILLLVLGVVYADEEGGLVAAASAYERADYETARLRFEQVATETGHCMANFWAGSLNADSYPGVTKDFARAMPFLLRAAACGVPGAAVLLANMYHLGNGVPSDRLEAYKWIYVASAGAVHERWEKTLALNPKEREKAVASAIEWLEANDL